MLVEKELCRYKVTVPKEIEAEYVFDGMDMVEKIVHGTTTEFVLKTGE